MKSFIASLSLSHFALWAAIAFVRWDLHWAREMGELDPAFRVMLAMWSFVLFLASALLEGRTREEGER